MKKIYSLFSIMIALVLCISCNDEWNDEQFIEYTSFKAPLNSQGVTPIYVRYKSEGKVSYQLPMIVSGSKTNNKNISIGVSIDPDTLKVINLERFSSRKELYYKELNADFYDFPGTVEVKAGENVSLLNIDFSLEGIDMVNKWILPLTILDDPSEKYKPNPRKHYRKALLRLFPFNDYSGEYSATAYKVFFENSESEAIVPENHMAYVVDETSIFFYAGLVDEERLDREHYKIVMKFNDDNAHTLSLSSNNPEINLEVIGQPTYEVEESMHETLPYLKRIHTYVNVHYRFTDYTSVPDYPLRYVVKGTLIQERLINTQIPDEDQAIQW